MNASILQELAKLEKEAQLSGNKRLGFTFNKAIKSIRAYPKQLLSGEEAIKLDGVGKYIASKIDEILEYTRTDPHPNREHDQATLPIIPLDVKSWLESLGLECYHPDFVEAGYDNILAIEDLSESDFVHLPSITKPGHRKTLLKAAALLRCHPSSTPPVRSTNSFASPLPTNNSFASPLPTNNSFASPLPTNNSFASPLPTNNSFTSPLPTNNSQRIDQTRLPPLSDRSAPIDPVPVVTMSFIETNANSANCSAGWTLRNNVGAWERREKVLQTKVGDHCVELETLGVRVVSAECDCRAAWCAHVIITRRSPQIVAALLTFLPSLPPSSPFVSSTSFTSPSPSSRRISAGRSNRKLGGSGTPTLNTAPSLTTSTTTSPSPSTLSGPQSYVPKFRSGGWALLVALHELKTAGRDLVTKHELVEGATLWCDTTFHGTGYTAWSSMRTLISKAFVTRSGSPPSFSLTVTGASLAQRLRFGSDTSTTLTSTPTDSTPIPGLHSRQTSDSATIPDPTSLSTATDSAATDAVDVRDRSGDYNEESPVSSGLSLTGSSPDVREGTIVLLIDNREFQDKQWKHQDLFNRLQAQIRCEKRNLELGDMMWIVHEKGQERVLNFIVERKRVSDLAASLEDGRYLEQKFRLRRCELHVVYLVEGIGESQFGNQFEGALLDTLVNDGFFIHRSTTEEATASYLITLTQQLEKSENPTKSSFSYDEFSAKMSKSKHLTLRDVFAKQLLQIPHCSPSAAEAVVAAFGTPHLLQEALKRSHPSARSSLLQDLPCGPKRRRLGPSLAASLQRHYDV